MKHLIVALTLLIPAFATAQRIELVERVSVGDLARPQNKSVGDARYLPMSELVPTSWDFQAEVLDLQTKRLELVITTREKLTAKFGQPDVYADDGSMPPRGELVSWKATHAGFLLYHIGYGPVWYAEIERKTGDILRSKTLATIDFGQLTFVGTDPVANAAWFTTVENDPSRRQAKRAVLRRLDLATLAMSDEMTVPLRKRTGTPSYDDERYFHHSPDFSRFVIVDYFEDGMARGDVVVLDAVAKTSFAIKAPSTAYGIAFSPDMKWMYIGSCQKGTIARVDLAARRVDRQVPGTKLLHHLIVSPHGKLFALGSSAKLAVSDLGLDVRAVVPHATALAPSFRQLFGAGSWSRDGKFIVLQDASTNANRGDYVIAKLVD